jgi:hypothetical protein
VNVVYIKEKKMRRGVLVLSLIASMFSQNILAATEFLRFEGNISGSYGDGHPGYDASFNFKPHQWVYFDFQIDTDLDVASRPDNDYVDNFAVSYLEGAVGGSSVTYGTTSTFPEGWTTWLFVADSLRVGTSWSSLPSDSYSLDLSIDTWDLGDSISLMNNSYFSEHIIGSVTMTYRGSTLPPSVVPLPAASWLFISGLGLLSFANRKRT